MNAKSGMARHGAFSTGYGALGPDWVPGPDGIKFRRAARVIVLDDAAGRRASRAYSSSQEAKDVVDERSEEHDAGRALLVRGHDADQPSRSWWFTVGGGIDAGESDAEAAARELAEETGLQVAPGDLIGPVMTRTGLFHFFAETCRQAETFFVAYAPAGWQPNRSGWTTAETNLLDELAWFTPAELRAQPLEVFPAVLPDVIEQLAGGWTGVVVHLGEEDDDAGRAAS